MHGMAKKKQSNVIIAVIARNWHLNDMVCRCIAQISSNFCESVAIMLCSVPITSRVRKTSVNFAAPHQNLWILQAKHRHSLYGKLCQKSTTKRNIGRCFRIWLLADNLLRSSQNIATTALCSDEKCPWTKGTFVKFINRLGHLFTDSYFWTCFLANLCKVIKTKQFSRHQ